VMHFPQAGDYIDIHVHSGKPSAGIFILETLMAHEENMPDNLEGVSYTYGIHPWFLNEANSEEHLLNVKKSATLSQVLAIGEAGFDKLRGPSMELQRRVFEEQVILSENIRKPLIIHCVRAWEELLSVQKKLKPEMPWLIHGFRGNIELAAQLLSKGMYLSFWFDFILRPESSALVKSLPADRIFLETDGADVDISAIYEKVANDLNIEVDKLKSIILKNFETFFSLL
jgi:TatD DNase family protein